jgi:DNA polymerase III sliding clamp (beta) subunit (PCNA family)
MTERETPVIRLEFEPGRVTATASNHDKGESTATAPTEFAGEFEIAFNSKFFAAALKVFPASAGLVMLANAPERQVIMFDSATGKDPFFVLVMPINQKKEAAKAPEPDQEPDDSEDDDEQEGEEE